MSERRSGLTRLAVLAISGALLAFGCTNQQVAPAEGSWIEVIEMEQTPEAFDVEAHPGFRTVEILTDRLLFRFDGPNPVREGQILGGLGPDHQGYIRRVTSIAELADGRIEVMTEHAETRAFYSALEFVLHYDPVRLDQPARFDEGQESDVGEAIEALGRGGCNDVGPCEMSKKFGDDTVGCELSAGAGLNIEPYVETDFSRDFPVDLWDKTAYFELTGELRAGVRVDGSAAARLECDADFAAKLGGGEAPEVTLFAGSIGVVPVTLTATPILKGSFVATADVGEFDADLGAKASGALRAGFIEGEGVGETEFEITTVADVNARAGALSAQGELEAGVRLAITAGPRIEGSLFGVSVDAGATVTGWGELKGTLEIDLNADAQGCEWNVDVPWSIGAEFGVNIEAKACGGVGFVRGCLIDWNESWTSGELTIAEGELVSASGELLGCGMSEIMECGAGTPTCHDDAYDLTVCSGMSGFQSCGSRAVQYCTCTPSGWSDCSPCMPL